MSFLDYAAEHGWHYHEETVPAGEGVDEDGETFAWDDFTARHIYKEAPHGDVLIGHVTTVNEWIVDSDWQKGWEHTIRLAEAGLARTIEQHTE